MVNFLLVDIVWCNFFRSPGTSASSQGVGLALITSTALRVYIYTYTDIHTHVREYIRSIIRTNFFSRFPVVSV